MLNKYKLLVIGDRVWGKGDTIRQALAEAKKNNGGVVRLYLFFLVHRDTYIDPFGNMVFGDKEQFKRYLGASSAEIEADYLEHNPIEH